MPENQAALIFAAEIAPAIFRRRANLKNLPPVSTLVNVSSCCRCRRPAILIAARPWHGVCDTGQLNVHTFVVTRREPKLAGEACHRDSSGRSQRESRLKNRPLAPGRSNLGEGRGPCDSRLPGRYGGRIAKLTIHRNFGRQRVGTLKKVSVRPPARPARRDLSCRAGLIFSCLACDFCCL